MQELIIHLLKSAGLLSLFFAAYYFLLKNDTSFKSNRIFLLAGILTSIFLPFLEITRTVMVETTAAPVFMQDLSNIPLTGALEESAGIDWWQVAGIIYLLGFGFFLLKFLIELLLLLKLIFSHKISRDGEFYIIQKCGNDQPFSFFKFIVFDPNQHTPTEQELILRHERCHARQWHSIDQLLISLCAYLLWFNPLAWLYRKSVVQNLEYLADKEVIAAKVSKKEYQKTLLKISVGNIQPALTNQFYQSFIKKRIIMLNKNSTQQSNFWKTSLLLPFLLLFIFSFNIKTEAREIPGQDDTLTSKDEISVYVTKDSDEESLRAHERAYKDHEIDLKFDNLQYSQGLLTRVTASFRKESTGTSGNLTLTNTNGISPLLIHTDGEQVTMTPTDAVPGKPKGAGTIKKEKTGSGTIFKLDKHSDNPETKKEEHSLLQKIKMNPLYVIGGKEYSASELSGKFIHVTGRISSLTPEEGKNEFGKKAKDGVLIVSEGVIGEDLQEEMKRIDKEETNWYANYLEIWKNKKPALIRVDKRSNSEENSETQYFWQKGKTAYPVKIKDGKFKVDPDEIIATQNNKVTSVAYSFQEEKPLIIVGGKIQDKDFNLNSIEPQTIKSLNVLKGESATEKYGKRAENGAIEIILKTDAEILKENEKKQAQGSGTTKEQNFKTEAVSFRISEKQNGKSSQVKVINVDEAKLSESNALFVVNGKEMDKDFDPDSIDPNTIQSISVLKGPKAIEKYGEKAGEGVIEITTKK